MNIYKLNYISEEIAKADLLAKGVYIKDGDKLYYSFDTKGVLDIGKIVKIPATFDDEGNLITEPIYYDGVFYDLMTTQNIDFGTNEVFPLHPEYAFAGD